MTHSSQSQTIATRDQRTTTRFGILRTLTIWHDAWRELQHVRRLDAEALQDMGITCAQRDAITLRQIVDRMRG